MRVGSLVAYVVPASPVYFTELKKLFVGDRRRTSATLIIHWLVVRPVTPTHPSLVAPSVVSAGDLTMPPELFASDGSAPGTTSVGGVAVGCASGADVTGAGGANTAGAGGADDTSARWGGATLLQGVPTQVELSADDVPVGPIIVGADGVDPRSGDDAGSLHRDLVVWGTDSCTLGHTTLATRSQPSCPQVPWARGLLDCFCPVTPILHSRSLTVANGE
jgi:hypothetical protein